MRQAACQVCYVDPAITIHESSQLRCCLSIGCSDYLDWLSEEEAEGRPSRGNQGRAIRGIQMKSWVTSLKGWVFGLICRLRRPLSAG